MHKPVTAIVLAAGKGTRMKSATAKVLHQVFYVPMVHHVIEALLPLQPEQTIVVVGHQRSEVESSLQSFPVSFAVQTEQLGTGHAVLAAEPVVENEQGTVVILCGDTPLILPQTLQAMIDQHHRSPATLTLMTTLLDDPTNYGRVISTESGTVLGIVEEKDASEEQKAIKEVNAGIYCVDRQFLFRTLKNVGTDNKQGEVYLTDIVGMAVHQGLFAEKFINPVPEHVLGVNSRVELAQAHMEIGRRRNRRLMEDGITMHLPETITVEMQAEVGRDTVIEPSVKIGGKSVVGENCVIGQGAVIIDSTLGDGVTVGPYACLKNQSVADGREIEPLVSLVQR